MECFGGACLSNFFYPFLGAFIITIITIKLLFPVSFSIGLIDHPVGRKKHEQQAPLIGGIAIFCGFTIPLLFLFYQGLIQIPLWFYLSGSFLLMIVSIMDDRHSLSVELRMCVQIIAVLFIIFFENPILLSLDTFSMISDVAHRMLLSFAIVGVVNAVNMMDGVDGLIGSLSLAICLVLFYLAIQIDALQESILLVLLMGSLVAFLLFNFPCSYTEQHKVFLGDAGSIFLGFTLSWLCLHLTQGEHGYPPVLMLWILALPVMDTSHLIINRMVRGSSPFKSDRRHIHHMLLHLNYTPLQTTLILMGISLSFCLIGLALVRYGATQGMPLLIYCILFLGYYKLSYLLKKKVGLRARNRFSDGLGLAQGPMSESEPAD